MKSRVINLVRLPSSPPPAWLLAVVCLAFFVRNLPAQQSGFQTDGTPVPGYPGRTRSGKHPNRSLSKHDTGGSRDTGRSQQAPGVPGAAYPQVPGASGNPQVVYPPVYSPETQARPPRAIPVPEPKKSKFGLFKRKEKDTSNSAQRSPADTDSARVYPDPSTQAAMQPRTGMDNRYPVYPPQPTTDPYGRTVMPDGSTVTAQPEMQPRPGADNRSSELHRSTHCRCPNAR